MANKVVTKSYGGPEKHILIANDSYMVTLGAQVTNTGIDADANGRKILYAGTPLAGNIEKRDTAFVKSSIVGSTAGVFTVQITTAFANDEVLTIDGVNYTKAATESVEDKKFAGSTAGDQVTSLKKMVTSAKYTVTGATDTLTFTQKVADGADSGPSVSKTATTGAFTKATGTEPVSGTSNAVAVILHDVDVTAGAENATIVLAGCVDLLKLTADTKNLVTDAVKSALPRIIFVEGSAY